MGAFRTEWDTDPNPAYDMWSVANGRELVPGVLSPFTATMYSFVEARAVRSWLGAYPAGTRVRVFKPPIGNLLGTVAGRLAINVGFVVAAMSIIDPDVATTIAGQLVRAGDDTRRLIARASAADVAASYEVARRQRATAHEESMADQQRLYEEQLTDQRIVDRHLPVKAAWKRLGALLDENEVILDRHLVVSVAAAETAMRLAGTIGAGGGDPDAVAGLTADLDDVESGHAAQALQQLGQVARKTAVVRSVIEQGDTASVLERMASGDRAWLAFNDEFDEFVHRYGFRGHGGADPTVPDWGEDPASLIGEVRSMMMQRAAADSPAAQRKAAASRRTQREKTVRASLSADVRTSFDDALQEAQRFAALRSLTKAVWLLNIRRQRPVLLALADGLATAGHLRQADDLLYCTWSDVESLVKDKAVESLAAAIRRRRAQRTKAEGRTPKESWTGTVHLV